MNRIINSSSHSSAIRTHSFLIRWSMLGLLLFAFGLRMVRLDHQSLWYDEGVTATIAQRSLTELTTWTARDIQPPLYYYLVAFWGRFAGWSEWSLRFPSLFWGADSSITWRADKILDAESLGYSICSDLGCSPSTPSLLQPGSAYVRHVNSTWSSMWILSVEGDRVSADSREWGRSRG